MAYVIPHIDYDWVRGDSQLLSLIITRDNLPVDISLWTIYFTVKQNINDSDVKAVIKVTVATTDHTFPLEGKTVIDIPGSTTLIPLKSYHYDIRGKDASDNPHTLQKGTITIMQAISERANS